MEFEQEKLISLIREEAIRKIVSERKKEVESFLSLSEQVDPYEVPQRAYLQGPRVRELQTVIGLSASTVESFRDKFFSSGRDGYCDGFYGRVPADASQEEKEFAFSEFQREVSQSFLGPYTHKTWENWVYSNYGDAQIRQAEIAMRNPEVANGLAQIYVEENGEQSGPRHAPTPQEVADNWEIAGRQLGWTIDGDERLQSAIRATTTTVRNAAGFVRQVRDPSGTLSTGGFNPNLLIRAKLKQEESARDRDDQRRTTSSSSGVPSILDTDPKDIPQGTLPPAQGETTSQYQVRRDGVYNYIRDSLSVYGGTRLVSTPETAMSVTFGGLMGYDGAQSGVSSNIYYLVDGNVSTRSPNSRSFAPLHPIFTSATPLDEYASQMEGIFKSGLSVIGTNVSPAGVQSVLLLIGWLGGFRAPRYLSDSGRDLDGGGSDPNRMGRAGFRSGDDVFDAVSYVLNKFATESSFDTDVPRGSSIIEAIQAAEFKGSDDATRDNYVRQLQTMLSQLGVDPKGSPNGSTRLGRNGWSVDAAKETTRSWQSVFSGNIRESFGVTTIGSGARRTRPRPSRQAEPADPSPQAQERESSRNIVLTGMAAQADTQSISKARQFLNLPPSGRWDSDADNAFIFYVEQNYAGKNKPGLISSMRSRPGWVNMTEYMRQNNIASFSGGAGGLLDFLLDASLFERSQRRRIRRFRRDNK